MFLEFPGIQTSLPIFYGPFIGIDVSDPADLDLSDNQMIGNEDARLVVIR